MFLKVVVNMLFFQTFRRDEHEVTEPQSLRRRGSLGGVSPEEGGRLGSVLQHIASMLNSRLGRHYGAIAFYNTILHNVFLLYHVETFVSVYKIDKTSFWIGETIFLVWNSFNDPLFGWMSDKQYLTSGTVRTLLGFRSSCH